MNELQKKREEFKMNVIKEELRERCVNLYYQNLQLKFMIGEMIYDEWLINIL